MLENTLRRHFTRIVVSNMVRAYVSANRKDETQETDRFGHHATTVALLLHFHGALLFRSARKAHNTKQSTINKKFLGKKISDRTDELRQFLSVLSQIDSQAEASDPG
jgi:hypothetical protein